MFIGIQNEKPCFIGNTREELENLPCVQLDSIEEVEFAEMYNGVIYLSKENLDTAKQEVVRSVRNDYLVEYVDKIVSNPLRWADMTEEEQNKVKNYRKYLLDYTEEENWWEQNPKTFNEWVKE